MTTRICLRNPVIALALAAGLLAWCGCLPDFDQPEPKINHQHHDWDGDGYCEDYPCEPGVKPGDCNDANPSIHPGADEACDGIDTDCDGEPGADEVDGDGDTFLACNDCDDTDAHVFPGAEEVCDGVDTDCDGVLSPEEIDDDGDGVSECEGDCDDGLDSTYPGAPEICDGFDNDCDGTLPVEEADGDGDGVMSCDGDCDDANPDVYTGAPEICDGIDNDCSGGPGPDEVDADGDGQMVCDGDCDDSDPTVGTGFPELCDEVDNDCDGSVDNDVVLIDWYPDNDGDGYGNPQGPVIQDCQPPANHVQDNTDCDDTNAAVHPDIFEEQCDGVDTNCDGMLHPDEIDSDGDGVTHCEGDCDDADPNNFPGNIEVCDGGDNNCDNVLFPGEVDSDGDGQMNCAGDCDDTNPAVYLGAPEICDGILDNNCDGDLDWDDADEDVDGYAVCDGDCSDADALTYPGATELCDGLDNNCDGFVPNDEADYDNDGTRICEGDCDDNDPALNLEDEDGDGFDTCWDADCDDYDPWTYPGAPEECDGIDNDCDGVPAADEYDNDGDGWLACAECDDTDADIYPGADDPCGDGIDQDCDGADDACPTCMALALNGAGDGLAITGPPAFGGMLELTVELWFRPLLGLDDNADGQVLIDAVDSFGDPVWRLDHGVDEAGWLTFQVDTTIERFFASFPVELPAGQWAHVVGTFDGNHARLFLDGELLAWDGYTGNPITVSAGVTGLFVGQDSSGSHEASGAVDEIRVLESVDNAWAVLPYQPVVVEYDADTLLLLHLDEGQGTPADAALIPHVVTLVGGPAWVAECPVPVASTFSGLGLGEFHSCGLRPYGTVQCWGDDSSGQSTPPPGPFVHVDGGLEHTCGIDAWGQIQCWGCGSYDVGQCTPQTPEQTEYVQVTAGWEFSCALDADGGVSCWGSNVNGQLATPMMPFEHISAGSAHACGLTEFGAVFCWGDNNFAQASLPPFMTVYRDVSAGGFHTCAIEDSSGELVCWGAGTTDADCNTDVECGQSVPPVGAFRAVACGDLHSCALTQDDHVTCWGDDSQGQVSDAPNVLFEVLSAGGRHTCGVTLDGEMLCWGDDSDGQVSDIP